MKPLRTEYRFIAGASLMLLLALLLGCPAAGPPPADPPHTPAEPEEEPGVVPPPPDPAPVPADPPVPAEPADEPAVSPEEELSEQPPEEPAPVEEPAEEVPQLEPVPSPEQPDDTAMDFPKPSEVDNAWEMPEPEPWELGPPLVDTVEALKPLDPEKPVWLDMQGRSVVFVGKICQREVPLELFACLRYTKEHEAIVVADVRALTVHAGLLAIGAEPGSPVQFHPEYVPASGTEIDVAVRWKDSDGSVQTARAQDWIQNTETGEAMTQPWVFAGSGFWVEPNGEKRYQAEGGDFICVANFGTAMLDVPVESSQANHMLTYRAFTPRIPPLETPVTVILTPKLQPQETDDAEETDDAANAEEAVSEPSPANPG